MKKILVIIALVFSSLSNAEQIERLTITSCAYQAGTAREIQTVRQIEGDDWPQFEKKIKQIYAQGRGRSDLLAIAKIVYLQPVKVMASEIYNATFSACVQRNHDSDLSA